MGNPRRWIIMIAATAAWSCWLGDSRLGPDVEVAQLSLVPVLSGPAPVGIADVRSARVVITRQTDGSVVVDTTIVVASSELLMGFSIPYTPPRENFDVEVFLLDSNAGVVFQGGPTTVTLGDQAQPPSAEIAVRYVGPGRDAASLVIDPQARTIVEGEAFLFTTRMFRGDGSETFGTPVDWVSLDPGVATVPDASTGLVEAAGVGTARIVATAVPLAAGELADTALLTVAPPEVPALSIDDVSVIEGNAGTVEAVFTVTASVASAQPVAVDYATVDGSATAGSDYVATSGTLTFAPGAVSSTVVVQVSGDVIDELNEQYTVQLSNPVNATIEDGSGVGTIRDDDGEPALSISDVTVTEGSTGTVDAVFAVTLLPQSSQTVTVAFSTVGGTATAGSDFVAASGTLTFAPGETAKTVTVKVIGDLIDEPDEQYTVQLANPTNATISDATGTGTIKDDDGAPTLSIDDVTVVEGNTGTVGAMFTVTLSAASGRTVTAAYATADGSALAGADYVAAAGTLTFAPGDVSKTVTVQVDGDLIDEPDEQYTVQLGSPTNATILDATGTGTITDDDGEPALSIDDVTVVEGNSGTADAIFTVTLSAASGQTVTVQYATVDGTATAGVDYTATSGTLTFAPGDVSETLTVQVSGDVIDEPNEEYAVQLASPTNATIADGSGTGTIGDDDGEPALSIDDVTVAEGDAGTVDAIFTVKLSAASGQTVTVDYATADGTAAAGSDYVASSGTVTFVPGEVSETVTVQVSGDVLDETNEQYTVQLSNAANATIADGSGTGTITDDDATPSLSIDDVGTPEGPVGGLVDVVFTVTLSAASGQTVTVNYTTLDGTAIAGADYVAKSGTLTFTPGDVTETVAVAVYGEGIDEFDETFHVNLSNASNASISDGSGLGTINDNDSPPSLIIEDGSVTETDSGDELLFLHVSLSVPSGKTITVDFATADGSATSGQDYVSRSGTIVFSPGDTEDAVDVTVHGDLLDEPDETLSVTLSNPVNATITDAFGLGTIFDDDPLPSLAIDDVGVTEGHVGTVPAVFTVTLSAASGRTVTVDYATSDADAVADSDYVATSGTLTFLPGQVQQPVPILVYGDVIDEGNETFYVDLSGAANASISNGSGLGTIIDDDFHLLVELSGNYPGTISGNVSPVINCSRVLLPEEGIVVTEGTCSADYAQGTQITLSTTGSLFSTQGWDQPECQAQSPVDPCTFVMNEDRVESNVFFLDAPPPAVLIEANIGSGSGLVYSLPPLVNSIYCSLTSGAITGCDSQFDYPPGTIISLMAEPNQYSFFVGWFTDPDGYDEFPGCEGAIAVCTFAPPAGPGQPQTTIYPWFASINY